MAGECAGLALAAMVAGLQAPTAERVEEAEATVARAVQLHADGRLEEASEALVEAYELYPDRDYLFARGVIEREAGDCEVAVQLFESFIAEHPPLVDVQAAQAEIDACADAVEEPTVKTVRHPVPEPTVQRPTPAVVADRPTTEPQRRWIRDPLGVGLLSGGAVTGLVGGGLLVSAAARARRAAAADDALAYRDTQMSAQTLSTVGIAITSVGAAVLIGAVVRFIVVGRSDRRAR